MTRFRAFFPVLVTLLAVTAEAVLASGSGNNPLGNNNGNLIANVLDGLSGGLVVPIIQKAIAIGTICGLGFMIWRPEKHDMMKNVTGIALGGALGIGGLWVMQTFIFNPLANSSGVLIR
jgi:hypothetical protein